MKHSLRALTCLFLLTIVMSCQKENYEDKSPESTDQLNLDLRYSQISFKEVPKKNHELLKAVSGRITGFNHQRNDEQSTFLVDTSDVTMFEAENEYTSYTFRVINDESSNVLQNIVISEHTNDSTSIHLAEYTLDLTLGELAHRNASPHIVDSNFYSLDDPSFNYQSRTYARSGSDCVDIHTYTELFCKDGDGNWQYDNGQLGNGCSSNFGTEIEVTVVTISAGCSSGGGSSTGNGNTGSGNTGSGSTGGGSGNNTNDPPPAEEDCFTFDPDGNCIAIITKPISNLKYHAKSLKLQSDNIKVKNKINELVGDVASSLEEDGAQFDLISAPLAPLDYTVVNPTETGTTLTRFPDVRPNTEVNVHLHPRFGLFTDSEGNVTTGQLSPIFSDGDLIFMGDFFEDTNDNTNISSILTSDEGVFALRVTDSDRADYIEDKLNKARHERRFTKEFFAQVLTAPDDRPPYTNQEIIANFINFINTYKINDSDNGEGLGFTLFQAEVDANGNITGWTQKS